ncbi:ATP-dependent DNA helicase PIF1 [Stagonosporopsis vannaccii]|nr:ATP-dependent DNA helicase PIF1 [Stagonosporopsis vannaccii]
MPVLDDGPKLVPEQQHVVDLILQGHNVFYTGSAGCGKSTILKAFVKQLQNRGKRVKIVAPTNLAALNVGGQTTWNFAGWTPDSMKIHIEKLKKNSLGKESWKKFDETDVLVIDEISMIENLQFERLNVILKHSRGEKHGGGAFGGIQLIVTGDFYQLAPVKPFSHCMCGWELERDNQHNPKEYACTNKSCREHTFYDIDKWAFRSNAWGIHRQSDMMFKSILNRIRTDGTILKPHANVLLNHTSETEGAIEIYARRVDVDRVNNDNINKIPSSARAYKCVDHFDWPDHHRSDRTLERNTYRMPDGSLATLREHRFEPQIQLKLNERVVLQANLEPGAGLVNGAQGTIIEFKDFDEKALPKAPQTKNEAGELRGDHAVYRQKQIEDFANANGRQPWPVVRFTNGVVRTIFADCTVNVLGNEEPWCKLSRTQIPLTAGYAITVHKSQVGGSVDCSCQRTDTLQGMTLDRVTVDLARAFEPSQIYVALSRARSLKGLTVTALPRFDLGGANVQVTEFMENVVIKKKSIMY